MGANAGMRMEGLPHPVGQRRRTWSVAGQRGRLAWVNLAEYQQAIASHWAGRHVDATVIYELIHECVDERVESCWPVMESWTNEVYDIRVASGARFALRLARRPGDRFPAESWALQQCATAGIPVPQIVRMGRLDEPEPMEFCLMSWIEGDRLLWVTDKLGAETTCSLVEEAGWFLARLHRVPTRGFGLIDGTGTGPHESIKTDRRAALGDAEAIIDAAQSLGIDRGLLNAGLAAAVDSAPSGASYLVHGDFATKHIVVRNGALTAILDFEAARASDPAYDLAIWDLINGAVPPRSCLTTGYARAGGSISGASVAGWKCTIRLAAIRDNLDWFRDKGVDDALVDDLASDIEIAGRN